MCKVLIALLAIPVAHWSLSTGRAEEPLDSIMYRDPVLATPRTVYTLPPRLPGLWIEALERPEVSMKCQAAQAITLAHERGIAGMSVTIAPLKRELVRPEQHALTRLAVTKALISLDAKDAAPELAKAALAETELREMVDPALARWDYKPARTEWLERLQQTPNRRGIMLAMQSLAKVREEKAAPKLRELALDRTLNATARLEAARALGIIRTTGSEKDAEALAKNKSAKGITDRLVAVSLLRHHQGDDAIRQLQSLGRDSEPTVAAVALARLGELDFKLVVPLLDVILASPDANLRTFGVETLFRLPSDANLKSLGDRLNDPHPALRLKARNALRDLAAKAEWRATVIREGMRLLAGADWRGLEQAAILLAQLDHKAAAQRLLALLAHERPETFVAAAWSLRILAVPETLQPSLEFLDRQYGVMLKSGPTAGRRGEVAPAVDLQLAQLCQFLGQGRHRAADSLLRRFIPPMLGKAANPAGPESRAAAIWALGWFHEGKPVSELTGALSARIGPINPFVPEDARVRRMSAITLGRMTAKDGLPILREFYPAKKPTSDMVGNACGWAIEQITGEKVPAPETITVQKRDWFLTPLD